MGASEDLALPIIFMILLSGVASRDMEVFVYDTVSIRCSPNRSVDIQWHHNSDLNYVYAGGRFFLPYKGRLRLEKDETTGDYDLIIPNVTLEDAGWYLCQEELSGHRISKTQLTVLYVNPACSSNMPSDGFVGPNTCDLHTENMTLSCDVKFNGKPPYVIWRSANDSQAFCSSSCEDESNNRRICNLTFRADPLYDGSVFICDAITPSGRRYGCNSDIIKVWYFLADYQNAKKKIQENANCAVRSNLNVQYKWTLKKNSEHILLSANQTISFQQSGIHQCVVDYNIRNAACSALVLNITVDDIHKEESATMQLALAITLSLALVAAIALGGSVAYTRRRSKRKCMKCSVRRANTRELPCEHVVCRNCVLTLIEDNARTYGIECPMCKSPFSVTVVPKERRQKEQNKYVKDQYNVEMKVDRSPLCLKYKGVTGMAIMDNNIFVVYGQPCNTILKFDLDASDGNEAVPEELCISGMDWPRGMAASENHSCLYITDWCKTFGGKLWRYKYTRGEETRVNGPVVYIDKEPFGVWVSPKNDEVLVTCGTTANVYGGSVTYATHRGWIYIYKPSGDEFSKIRTIELPNLEVLHHAILTASSQFIVCHGWSSLARHGVTSFEDGKDGVLVAKRFYGLGSVGGGAKENEVKGPLTLTIDRNNMILVVDYKNSRIQLLTEDLQLVRHLLTKGEHGIEYPRHVCQDPRTGRLYVGQNDDKVRIFN